MGPHEILLSVKAKEVLRILNISRSTLQRYVKNGTLRVTPLPNGRLHYEDASVYAFFNKGIPRQTYLYARVSTKKQTKDLESQINLLKTYCLNKGVPVHGVFSDVASGISFSKRKSFFNLLDAVLDRKVEKVVISHKDRLSRVGYELFENLFARYGCSIEVVSMVGSEKLDSQEISEEILSLLHCYSMKLHSKSRTQRIKEALSDDDGCVQSG